MLRRYFSFISFISMAGSKRQESCDKYVLYEGIGMIPEDFETVEVGDTTRAVCRRVCSETYDLTCSGFLYNRRHQTCQLSAYTGEWVTADGRSSASSSGLEFYRRIRCLGYRSDFLCVTIAFCSWCFSIVGYILIMKNKIFVWTVDVWFFYVLISCCSQGDFRVHVWTRHALLAEQWRHEHHWIVGCCRWAWHSRWQHF